MSKRTALNMLMLSVEETNLQSWLFIAVALFRVRSPTKLCALTSTEIFLQLPSWMCLTCAKNHMRERSNLDIPGDMVGVKFPLHHLWLDTPETGALQAWTIDFLGKAMSCLAAKYGPLRDDH